MSASEQRQTEWLDASFWEQLDQLENRHRRAQLEHKNARRDLETLTPDQAEELGRAWQRYCEVIAELERVTTDFEVLLACYS
jgi:hypothetical protein